MRKLTCVASVKQEKMSVKLQVGSSSARMEAESSEGGRATGV